MRVIAALILLSSIAIVTAEQPEPSCSSSADCRRLALEAIERQDYEAAHTLAWRALQTGNATDPALMQLLARAQSLSGRPQDALIMLRRLADRGVAVVEAETHDDFRRVRSLVGWPEVLTRIYAAAGIKREVATPPAEPQPPAPSSAPTPSPPSAPAPAPPSTAPAAPAALPPPAAPPTAPAAPPPAAPSATAPTPKPAPATPPVATGATPGAGRPSAKEPRAEKGAATPSPMPKEDPPAKAPANTATEVLRIPSAVYRPRALDYDSVSQRFVVAEDGSDTLKVVDELAGNAVNLVSRGWAGPYLPTALAIDRRRGDLWVASAHESDGMSRAALHRLQLVSGRLLATIELPRESGAARFVDIALHGNNVLLLDAIGRRVIEHEPGTKVLRLHRKLDTTIDPVSLTPGESDVLYVAHANGIVRIDPATPKAEPLKAASKITLEGLQWVREYHGALVAIQGAASGARTAVRITLDRRGASVRSIEVLDQAGSRAASIADGVFYYIGDDRADGSPPLRRVKLN